MFLDLERVPAKVGRETETFFLLIDIVRGIGYTIISEIM